MSGLDRYDRLFAFVAFSMQIVLLVFFALRKWKFDTAMQFGWIVYALAVPAIVVSLVGSFTRSGQYLVTSST